MPVQRPPCVEEETGQEARLGRETQMLTSICHFLLRVPNLHRAASWGPSIQTREPMGHLVGPSFPTASALKSELQSIHFRPVSPWASHFQGIPYLFSTPHNPKCSVLPVGLMRGKSNHVPSLLKDHSCRPRQKQKT